MLKYYYLLTITLFACLRDDSTVHTEDFTTTIDENPEQGQLLGTVIAA